MILAYNDAGSREYGWKECWGVKFKWTPDHLTPKDLEPLTHTYDTVATEACESLNEISPPSFKNELIREEDSAVLEKIKVRRDLYELLQRHAATDEKLNKLWKEINTVPDWVDWKQLGRGQKVFYRYGGPAITAVSGKDPRKRTFVDWNS